MWPLRVGTVRWDGGGSRGYGRGGPGIPGVCWRGGGGPIPCTSAAPGVDGGASTGSGAQRWGRGAPEFGEGVPVPPSPPPALSPRPSPLGSPRPHAHTSTFASIPKSPTAPSPQPLLCPPPPPRPSPRPWPLSPLWGDPGGGSVLCPLRGRVMQWGGVGYITCTCGAAPG